ncbi:Gfo/Idh/MocA family protein [Rhodoligotrophos ferricapiens]|uniref:Gfo/Idh/MocA family protein n=1 Tax=Rhodoligotrophos ferricapiens TaxID=3069264 RepID=UPI00315CCC2B
MTEASIVKQPRLGFLGVGWIGRHRMEAIISANIATVAGIADPSPEMMEAARTLAPEAASVSDLDELLDLDLDGVVIATPSAMHAEQSIRALDRGVAVFCQKPLGRTAVEVEQVLATAKRADRLIAVDLSYRYTRGMRHIRELVQSGELGEIYAAELVFHNAYGPDKGWFYDPMLAGGGCVMDLGVHLVDLALWTLNFPAVTEVRGHLLAGGKPLPSHPAEVEDYADATLRLETGAVVRLACSWRLQAGLDASISAAFYGTQGGAALRNVDGSFYDFIAERYSGTARECLASPPDAWGGRAAVDWAMQLAKSPRFDPTAERLLQVSEVLDRIYGR